MTTQPEKTEPMSKDELSDKDLANVAGGGKNDTTKSASDTPQESLSLNFTKIEYKNTST